MSALALPETSADATAQLRRVLEMLDAHVMGPRLEAAVGGGGTHVLDAKYEPGVRCVALFRVGERLVRGDLLEDAPPARDDAAHPVVAPGVRLSPFPHDPDLPRLPETVDPSSLADALDRALPDGRPVRRCRVDLVRYRPAKRATLAVAVRRGGAEVQRLVVKSYHRDEKAAAVAAEAVLLDATADPTAPLRFAPLRAHVPELSLVVQERVTGTALDELIRRPGPAAAQALERAAVALAALHRQPVVSARTRAVDAEVARFALRSARVARVVPGPGAALADLADRLTAVAEEMPAGAVGLVHGDCKPSQFLVRERTVVLLDLDSCGRADPAGDVGTFLATLEQQTLRLVLAGRTTPADARARANLAAVFLHAYLEAMDGLSDEDLRRRISWYEAIAFERKALRCVARAPRSPLTRVLVASGHACLDRMGGIR
jgi:hypothetical protein